MVSKPWSVHGLGDDPKINEQEITNLISLADEGYVDIAAVGNEVMYRGDLTEDELLEFLYQVKEAIPTIPVGYVDAYYEFIDRPAIVEKPAILFWPTVTLFGRVVIWIILLLYMKDMYQRVLRVANGKKVIITETGWPSKGTNLEGAFPSYENAIKYFINSQKWSKEEEIEMFYFSSFDESWKVGAEGDVGAYWGLWDKNGKFKY